MPVHARREIFEPVLFEVTPSTTLTEEQSVYIKAILDVSCSDSRFAQKAYLAIVKVLAAAPLVPPVVESLSPNTVELGSPSFDLHVLGSDFNELSIIVFAGQEEPTTFVSATELTTGVDMSFWSGPDTVQVSVSTNGISSESVDFTFTEPVVEGESTRTQIKKDVKKQAEVKENKKEKVIEQYIDDPKPGDRDKVNH